MALEDLPEECKMQLVVKPVALTDLLVVLLFEEVKNVVYHFHHELLQVVLLVLVQERINMLGEVDLVKVLLVGSDFPSRDWVLCR